MKKAKPTKEEILSDNTLTEKEKYHKYVQKTEEWQQIRKKVLERDNYTCKTCNRTQEEINEYNSKKGKNLLSLVIHHKSYQYLFKEEENNYNDLICLCSACHRAIHQSPSNRYRFRLV